MLVDGVATKDRWLLKTNPDVTDMARYEYVAKQVIGFVFGQESNAVVDVVAMEGVYASRNLLTFGRLTALASIVQYALHRSNVPYLVLPPNMWRTAVFGPKSKIDKERVRAATAMRLQEHLGDINAESADLNVLEAFLVALAAWKMETGLVPKPAAKKSRKKALVEMKTHPLEGVWIGGVGRLRYYRVRLKLAAEMSPGDRFAGGVIRQVTTRGTWAQIEVEYPE